VNVVLLVAGSRMSILKTLDSRPTSNVFGNLAKSTPVVKGMLKE